MLKIVLTVIITLSLTACGNVVYSSDWQKAQSICEYNDSKVFKVDTSIIRTSLVQCENLKYYVLPER